ncbi:MAG: hypothetical protein LBO00_07095 [Zoogloeaceae bacterium]|nr:hypothetical protein [Zoogloeaceae bacterium]
MKLHLATLVLLTVPFTGAALAQAPAYADEAALLSGRGAPLRTHGNPDGTRTLEYSSQPNGISNWMYTVDATGRVIEARDTLEAASLAGIRAGMAQEEVLRLLGKEHSAQKFSIEEVWTWNVRNEWPHHLATRFHVHFVDRKVSRTSFSTEDHS